ncbi:MAG: hypothetical protein ACJ75J_06305 [Cytophagaceae bacterium]|jgi:hypothetical protein
MKKLQSYFVAALLFLCIIPTQLKAASPGPARNSLSMPAKADDSILLIRVNEINAMDKSALTSSEKRQLRQEIRGIKSAQTAHGNGGIYLSTGAIIIIILLLIILL